MKRTDFRFQTILAALLLLFELAVLFLPVFSGHTALELVRLQWQTGGTVLRLGIVLLLLLCPAISCGLLWQIHTLAAKAGGKRYSARFCEYFSRCYTCLRHAYLSVRCFTGKKLSASGL